MIGMEVVGRRMRPLGFLGLSSPPLFLISKDISSYTLTLINYRYDEVDHFYEKAPSVKMAQPTPDHFYPLHVAVGATGGNPIPFTAAGAPVPCLTPPSGLRLLIDYYIANEYFIQSSVCVSPSLVYLLFYSVM